MVLKQSKYVPWKSCEKSEGMLLNGGKRSKPVPWKGGGKPEGVLLHGGNNPNKDNLNLNMGSQAFRFLYSPQSNILSIH